MALTGEERRGVGGGGWREREGYEGKAAGS